MRFSVANARSSSGGCYLALSPYRRGRKARYREAADARGSLRNRVWDEDLPTRGPPPARVRETDARGYVERGKRFKNKITFRRDTSLWPVVCLTLFSAALA